MGHDFGPRRRFPAAELTTLATRIIAAEKSASLIPAGWALDVDGHPTTDASAALMGTVLPMAGHKGYALALLVEVLSSVLSGSAVGPAIGSMYKQPEKPQDAGHFFFLLDIEGFMDVGLFKHRIDAMVRQIKSCRTKPGVEEIRVPGEHSFRQRQENLAQGIPLDATTVSDLRRLCAELRVDPGESSSLIPGE